ncbi:MAG: DUF3488 domain-containing protein [Acidobacteria bacterium]|nr:DUF3488 domain-containing protein [Acidobacteriota bacterium]
MSEPLPENLPFRKERLLSLGTLSLLAPIPLALTFTLEPAILVAFLAILGFFMLRVRQGRVPLLPNWVLNVAAVAYLFVFALDLRAGSRSLLKTTIHLLLFVLLLKLASVRKERDFSVCLTLMGFLFLGSVATAFHVSIVAFVIVFAAIAWPILVKWALWRDLATAEDEWRREKPGDLVVDRRSIASSVAACFLLAIPFFVLLPRIKAPFLKGIAEGQEISTGFSESVDPNVSGSLKQSDKVVMRLTPEGPLPVGQSLYVRALAFAHFDGVKWRKPEQPGLPVSARAGGVLPLVPPARVQVDSRQVLRIDLQPLHSRYVPYPEDAVGLRFGGGMGRVPFVTGERDLVRNFQLSVEPDRTIQYEALVGGPPEVERGMPLPNDPTRRRLDSARVRALLDEILGQPAEGLPALRVASRIETHLATKYTYTLQVTAGGANPVEAFLFERKAGACESFANAMAVMLREAGIPSRFVTGFSGGEVGLFGTYVLVRGRDAHAWVEAWLGPELGWRRFDPTPSEGRPSVVEVPLSRRLSQVTDGMEYFFDRFVLGFSQSEQASLAERVREAFVTAADLLRALLVSLREGAGTGFLAVLALVLLAFLGLLVLLAKKVRHLFGPALPPATRAYDKLRRLLRRAGAPVTPASAPAETLAAAASMGAGGPARDIVLAYVEESFSGEVAPERRVLLDGLLADVRATLRKKPAQ